MALLEYSAIQRLRNIRGIKSQTYPQLMIVFNNTANTRLSKDFNYKQLIDNMLKIKQNTKSSYNIRLLSLEKS
jgi:DNA-binding TFAR19-related protein (PDSD5 family)